VKVPTDGWFISSSLLLGTDVDTLLLFNINTEQHARPQVLLNVASIVKLTIRIQNIVL